MDIDKKIGVKMKNRKLKWLIIITIMLITLNCIPQCVSYNGNCLNKEIGTNGEYSSNYPEIEIKVFGGFYVLLNRPAGLPIGLYSTFENKGSEPITVSIGYSIEAPMNSDSFVFDENITLEPGSIGSMSCAGIYGFGVMTFKIFLQGVDEFSDYYVEKIVNGICFEIIMFPFDYNWVVLKSGVK